MDHRLESTHHALRARASFARILARRLLIFVVALVGAPGAGAGPFLTSASTVAPDHPTTPGHGCSLASLDGAALLLLDEAVASFSLSKPT